MNPILVDRDGPIATVVLNNPAHANALTAVAWRGLTDAMRSLAAERALRCIVLRGAGASVFSVGADVAEFPAARPDARRAGEYSALVASALEALAGCRHPVVALIEGACRSEALALAALCDMRVCGESSVFSVAAGRVGAPLGPAELSAIHALAGLAVTLELLLDGREMSAPEAYRKHLVNRVAPDARVEAEAYAIAERIAAGAPLAARWNKQFVNRLGAGPTPAAIDAGDAFAAFDSEDYRAGIDAAAAGRAPRFKGR